MLSRLRTLHRAEPPDVKAVSRTADHLGVGPFDVFVLAYQTWYGERPEERAVERPFVRYLYTSACPCYVRHFARLVEIQAERGRLDRTEYGLPPKPRETLSPAALDRWSLAVYLGAFAAIFLVMPMLGGA